MKRRRHTPEQIVRKLGEADRLLGEGQELPEVVKLMEVSEATYHCWRPSTAGIVADQVRGRGVEGDLEGKTGEAVAPAPRRS
jgi:putative transposase